MIYVFGDYRLDTDRHELRHDGDPCPLEPQVYDVLLYLIRNRDRVVSKQELLDHVWPETFVSEAALYNRLRSARQAVGDNGRTQQVIKTVPKQGYRFSTTVEERDTAFNEAQTTDALEAAPPTPSPSRQTLPATRGTFVEEYRLVTVLCGRLSDPSAVAERLGFAALARLRENVFCRVSEEVKRYAGHVQPWGEDGFQALFGAPVAQEDHARRAVLAGLSLLQRCQEPLTDPETGQRVVMSLRVGGHTGQVMIDRAGREGQGLTLVGGSTTETAARLQASASPGQLLISDAVVQLVHGEVHREVMDPVPVPDQAEPITVYRVKALGSWRPFIGQQGVRTLSRFVGREGELSTLQRLLRQAASGQGQVVGVMGEPGMGKSRLLYEFVQQLDGQRMTYVEGHCLSYGSNTPYLPVLDLLRQLCDIPDTADSVAVTDRIHATLGKVGMAPDEGVPCLLRLLGIDEGTAQLAQLGPQVVKNRTFDTLRQLSLNRSQQQPLILAVENLHWIDPTSEEWLTSLVEHLAHVALLLIATYRPGYRPQWMDKSYATQVALSRLSPDDSRMVMQSVLQTRQLSDVLLQGILAKAAGNPFFLEELTRVIAEQRGDEKPDQVPDTVQGVLMARMDRLPEGERRLLQTASVIGRDVPCGLLQAVADQSESMLARQLTNLQLGEFLYEKHRTPEPLYTFKHALTQDVAYASLLPRTRRQIHQRIAKTLEGGENEIIETQLELMAHHYTEAGMNEQAITYWLLSGRHAIDHSAYIEGIEHLTKGIDLIRTLPETSQNLQVELEMQAALGPVLQATKGMAVPEVEQTYRRARELCQQLQDALQLFSVLRGIFSFYATSGQVQAALEIAEEMHAIAQQRPDSEPLILSHYALGSNLFYHGELTRSRYHLEQSIALYDAQQNTADSLFKGWANPGVHSRAYCIWVLWVLGYPEQALELSREAFALAIQLKHPFSVASLSTFIARVYQCCGDVDMTLEYAQRAVDIGSEQGFVYYRTCGTLLSGWAYAEQGHTGKGITRMQQGLEEMRATRVELNLTYFLTLPAGIYARLGRTCEAFDMVDDALTLAKKNGERCYESELLRLQGELLFSPSLDSAAEAESCFHQALDVARHQQAKSLELRAATSLARLWQQQGKRQHAYDLLAPVYKWFTEGFDTAGLKDAKSLLQELVG